MNANSVLILLVDDEPPVIDMLQRVGRQHFSQATFASCNSPQETLDYVDDAAKARPQLVLLDIDLHAPTNGLDLLAQIRQHPQAKGIPVVIFTGSAAEPDISRAYEVGAVAYIQKPDSLTGWVNYVQLLRDYWFSMATLPPTT